VPVRSNGPAGAQPQQDLFPEPGAGFAEGAEAFESLGKPLDRAALRHLVGELEALRSEMVKGV
jgi:hypothetical protein